MNSRIVFNVLLVKSFILFKNFVYRILFCLCVVLLVSCNNKHKDFENVLSENFTEMDYDKVKILLQEDKYNKISKNDQLLLAIDLYNEKLVFLLLQYGANPNIVCSDGISLLQWAIIRKNTSLMRLAVERDADVNFHSNNGNSVFGYAIAFLQRDDIIFLMDNGVDLTQQIVLNNEYISYCEYALILKKTETVKLILNNTEILTETAKNDNLALKLCYYWTDGTKEIADLLFASGLKLNDDKYPLIQYVLTNYDAVKWFLDHGVSPDKRFKYCEGYGLSQELEDTPIKLAKYRLKVLENNDIVDLSLVMELKKVIDLLERYIRQEPPVETAD